MQAPRLHAKLFGTELELALAFLPDEAAVEVLSIEDKDAGFRRGGGEVWGEGSGVDPEEGERDEVGAGVVGDYV